MDHRSRPRGIGLSRIPGAQSRTSRARLPFHVEQEAREGEDWEQREQLRQRTPVNGVSESEDLPDSVMGKVQLPPTPTSDKGGGFPFSFFAHRKGVSGKKTKAYNGQGWGER